jgi:hypothetical protein
MNVTGLKDVVANLEVQLVGATNRATALQNERRRVSYAAHTGDEAAHAVLEGLNSDSLIATLAIENAKSALEEARQKLAEAEREEELAAKRAKAEKVRRVTKLMERYGPSISSSLTDLCRQLREFEDALDRLREWDVPVASGRLVVLAFTRTILAKLREVGIVVDAIPPGLRSEPEYLVRAYLEAPNKWVADMLGEAADGAAPAVAEVA